MKIMLDKIEKELIYKYWYVAPESIKKRLLNNRVTTVELSQAELEDLIGFLSLECNHCNNKPLSIALNDLCEKLESEL